MGWRPLDSDYMWDTGGRVVLEAPPGRVVRSFYGRVAVNGLVVGLGVIFGPGRPARWRPDAPERFADAAAARARAVLALADDPARSRLASLRGRTLP